MVTAQPPFRHLWVWILVLAALAVVAFWPRYFGVFGTANWRLHVHGISAMAWMFLVALQAGLIHARKAAAHRWVAMSSVVVVPIFLVGGLLAVQTQGNGEGPFHQMFGPSLVAVDLLTMGLFAFLFAAGLATRSRPQLHARYMVGTLLPLIGPVGAILPPRASYARAEKLAELVRKRGGAAIETYQATLLDDPRGEVLDRSKPPELGGPI